MSQNYYGGGGGWSGVGAPSPPPPNLVSGTFLESGLLPIIGRYGPLWRESGHSLLFSSLKQFNSFIVVNSSFNNNISGLKNIIIPSLIKEIINQMSESDKTHRICHFFSFIDLFLHQMFSFGV